jgi:alpha-beta hydrolase superfamily lysophospholipase
MYFSPPPSLVEGHEWRLTTPLRPAAASADAVGILTDAVVSMYQEDSGLRAPGWAAAQADLAVTGRRAFADFVAKLPREGGPIEAAALAKLPGATPDAVRLATTKVLDRAYKVAWFLRGATARGDLGWIAVSAEDDLPHRPVNVPRTPYPQHDLFFTVPGDLGNVVVQTRYAIATAASPPALPPWTSQRTMPPVPEPALPGHDRIILFIPGSDSRLEEADDLIPKLLYLPDGRPSGFAVISMDLPGAGYANLISTTEVGAWPPAGGAASSFSMLPFLEKFLLGFVATLSTRLGQPGLVESRVAAVIGGSLGGNLALRLARRGSWIRNAVAWSPGSIWQANKLDPDWDVVTRAVLHSEFQIGLANLTGRIGQPETYASRDAFFASAFDEKIPFKTQPEQWYRDDFPWKPQYILNARMDRRETYTPQFRDWHWRVSLEELAWSWKEPTVQDFRSRLLLGAGAADDIAPAHIFKNTQDVATKLSAVDGDTFFLDHTGHSAHAERPALLAGKIMAFLGVFPQVTITADYDHDGRTDFAVWRPATGEWFVIDSSTGQPRPASQQWGQAGDIPVPGDYDGDGRTDFAVWRPSTGEWFVIDSSTGKPRPAAQQWGQAGDIPVPGDYDGDGRTDFAVWRPSTGEWFVIDSSTGKPRPAAQQWGQAGDIPVPGDYDGDGRTDFAVWRPSTGEWFVIDSSTGKPRPAAQQWGQAGDIPVPGHYDGDRRTDFAVWRPSTGQWWVIDSSTGQPRPPQQWGQAGDIPVPGDYDGDRRTDFAVWRPATAEWFVIDSSTGQPRPAAQQWGQAGDVPV